VRVWGIHTGFIIEVNAADRIRLAVVADRNSPQKHVWRSGGIKPHRERQSTSRLLKFVAARRLR